MIRLARIIKKEEIKTEKRKAGNSGLPKVFVQRFLMISESFGIICCFLEMIDGSKPL